MKKIMFILTAILILLVIMSSALKPREKEETQKQIAINEPINVAAIEGNKNQDNNKTVLELQNILPEKYKEIKLVKIKWGSEKNNLKCTQGVGATGPWGIALDTLENIYILDNFNGAVKKYNNKGELAGVYLNEDIEFHNTEYIEVSEDGKYIYGNSTGRKGKFVYIYNTEKRTGEHILEGKDYQYKSIPHGVEIYQNGTLVKRYGGSTELTKENKPEDKMKDIIDTKNKKVLKPNKLKPPKRYNNEYAIYKTFDYYYIGKDKENNYYLATYYPKQNQDWREQQRSKTVVYKYKETGEILSLIILEENEIDYLNYYFQKHIRVNKDGDIYYLCPKEDGAEIYQYESVK
ncbi:MAG: hypothetical protein R6U31_05035 [bacterium]